MRSSLLPVPKHMERQRERDLQREISFVAQKFWPHLKLPGEQEREGLCAVLLFVQEERELQAAVAEER